MSKHLLFVEDVILTYWSLIFFRMTICGTLTYFLICSKGRENILGIIMRWYGHSLHSLINTIIPKQNSTNEVCILIRNFQNVKRKHKNKWSKFEIVSEAVQTFSRDV